MGEYRRLQFQEVLDRMNHEDIYKYWQVLVKWGSQEKQSDVLLAHPIAFMFFLFFFMGNNSLFTKNMRKSCDVFEKNVSLRQK